MSLFNRNSSRAAGPAWRPQVNLATAGAVVHALANGPGTDDARMRAAIAEQVRASDAPTDMMTMVQNIQTDPNIVKRPWIWLLAVQRQAVTAGDHHVSAAALLWASYFTGVIVPKYERPTEVWGDTQLDLIPADLKAEILELGMESVAALPPAFVVAGSAESGVTAASLAALAPGWLGG